MATIVVNKKAPSNYEAGRHYSREFEAAVLGVCLLEPDGTARCINRAALAPVHFYDDSHKALFIAMAEMHHAGKPIDLLTVWQYLLAAGVIAMAGNNTAYFLSRLTNSVVTGSHLDYHCSILIQMTAARAKLAAKITGRAKDLPIGAQKWKAPAFARFYLKFSAAAVLRYTASKYGLRLIPGLASGCLTIRVDNEQLVYMMHLLAPQYTWTCGSVYDAEYTRAECLAAIKPGHRLVMKPDKKGWF